MSKANILALLILTAAIASTVSSCRLGRKFEAPAMQLPERFVTDVAPDTFSLAEVDWHTVYTDPQLQRLIERVLKGNRDLARADASIRRLAALRRVSKADLLPSVGGNLYAQKETTDYGGDSFKNDPEEGLKASLTWEPDLWGRLRWADEEARSEWLASVEGRRALACELIASTARTYYELVALDNELAIAQNTLTARAESERIARLRWEGGLTSEIPFQQARIEHNRAKARIPVIERSISTKKSEITLLLGEFPGEVERTGRLTDVDLPASLPVGLTSDLLRRRPDIRQAEMRLRAANAAVGVAYTDRFPRLTLTASGGVESEQFATFFKSPFSLLSAGLLGPIFDFGRRQGRYRAAEAAWDGERLAYEQTVTEAFTEVHDAIVDFGKVKEIYSTSATLEASTLSALKLAQLQYINGATGYIDLLDVQRSHYDAQIALNNALLAKRLCIIRLYRVLGGGWQL